MIVSGFRSRVFGNDSFVAKSLRLLAMRVGARVLAFPTTLVLARALGAAEYGRYAYGLAWASLLATPAALGFDRYLVREVARLRAQDAWAAIRTMIGWATRQVLVASIGLGILALLVSPFFVRGGLLDCVRIGLILVPLTALTLVRQSALQGLHKVELSFVPEQIFFPVLFLALVAVAVGVAPVHLDAVAALILNVAAASGALVVGVYLLRRQVRFVPSGATTKPPRGIQTTLFTIISLITVASGQIGSILLGSLSTASAVGVYQIALKLADLPAFALTAAVMQFAPLAAHLGATDERAQLQRRATRTARACVAFALPIVLVIVVWRHPLVHLFGGSYGAGATAVVILALAQLASAVTGPVGILLLMTGGERLAAAAFGAALAVDIAVTAALVPTYGATGAAIGRAADLVAWNVLLWMFTIRRLGIDGSILGRVGVTVPSAR